MTDTIAVIAVVVMLLLIVAVPFAGSSIRGVLGFRSVEHVDWLVVGFIMAIVAALAFGRAASDLAAGNWSGVGGIALAAFAALASAGLIVLARGGRRSSTESWLPAHATVRKIHAATVQERLTYVGWRITYTYEDRRQHLHTETSDTVTTDDAKAWNVGEVGLIRYDPRPGRCDRSIWLGQRPEQSGYSQPTPTPALTRPERLQQSLDQLRASLVALDARPNEEQEARAITAVSALAVELGPGDDVLRLEHYGISDIKSWAWRRREAADDGNLSSDASGEREAILAPFVRHVEAELSRR